MQLSLWRDRRGVAATEFALIAPILILLYFGVVELTQASMAQQRVDHAASAVGDLVAQSSTIDQAEVTDIFNIGGAVMYPYSSTGLGLRVSSLTADARGNVTVAWSQASGGMTALTKGSSVSGAPANVIAAGESAVMAESSYRYTSTFQSVLPHPIVFTHTYYLRPRLSDQVTCADC